MLVTLVALLCNGPLCLEKVVTNSEQSNITLIACQIQGQQGAVQWMANSPYRDWKLQGFLCVSGTYISRQEI